MSVYVIYFSPTKSTENIVKEIAKSFEDYIEIDLANRELNSNFVFNKNDICIIGVPSYGGRVPSVALERMNEFKGNGVSAILVASYGNRAYEDTLKELQEYLTQRNFYCIAGIAAIAEHSIMHQFATGRPDDADKKELGDFSKRILDKINKSLKCEPLKLPGNYPYREYNGVPLKPKVRKGCMNCGLCAKMCPVGAISITELKKTDNALCITCMRCVDLCPAKARTVSNLKLKIASMKMKKVCSQHKGNELFI
ncbi:4Fe-4S binding protein [Robinsoniella peoriensis]|uniref:4Fe-4S binding protein n=1 Tax=Robinsoniella peoriensis TaxID=180332 RepID=UPI00363C4BA9